MTPYASVHQFFTQYGIVKRNLDSWRTTKPIHGQINGLPNFAGWLVATDGILCYLETELSAVIEGHLQWFVPDDKEEVIQDTQGNVVVPGASKLRLITDSMILDILSQLESADKSC